MPQPSRKKQPQDDSDDPGRDSPFKRFVKSIGLDCSNLPKFTNGDVRAFAEVDIPTMHNWSYLNGDLPEATLELMKEKLLQEYPVEEFGAK